MAPNGVRLLKGTLVTSAFTHIREDVEGAEQIEKEIQRLQEFVGQSSQSKSSIWDSLRHNLTNVKRWVTMDECCNAKRSN